LRASFLISASLTLTAFGVDPITSAISGLAEASFVQNRDLRLLLQ
jgi:hypothetical protein